MSALASVPASSANKGTAVKYDGKFPNPAGDKEFVVDIGIVGTPELQGFGGKSCSFKLSTALEIILVSASVSWSQGIWTVALSAGILCDLSNLEICVLSSSL